MHLGWVPDGTGGYRGQMAVLVKPNGLLGNAYMAAIKPFRHLIVYPPMIRGIEREWRVRSAARGRRRPASSLSSSRASRGPPSCESWGVPAPELAFGRDRPASPVRPVCPARH